MKESVSQSAQVSVIQTAPRATGSVAASIRGFRTVAFSLLVDRALSA